MTDLSAFTFGCCLRDHTIQKQKQSYEKIRTRLRVCVFVWDEPDKTWPRLPRTFTQKWINLFNHAELPLCIPDEAVGANLFLLSVFPAIFESLNMLGKVLENTRGDIMTVCGSGHVPWPVFTTEACAPPLVFLWVSMWELGFVKA